LLRTATNEDGLNFYELQKSSDGIHFETMVMVFVKETASDDYNFPDKNPSQVKIITA